MTVAVLFGGKSGEHEVSLVSASSVVRHINRRKHSVILIGIAKDGRWYMQDETELHRIHSDETALLHISQKSEKIVCLMPGGTSSSALRLATSENGKNNEQNIPVDIVFPVLHGSYGEDGFVQGLLEMAELPYCGCSVSSSAIAMDKEQTKRIWMQAGLPVVPFVCVKNSIPCDSVLKKALNFAEKEFCYPLFVKPCGTGSSVGAAKALNKKELELAVQNAFLWDEKVLIEPCIDAREIECSVTGNSMSAANTKNAVRSYEAGEIAPTHSFYDYEAKYTDTNGARLLIPAPISGEQRSVVKTMAEKAYSLLGCSGLARVDFFIDKKSGKLYLNEINTMPGFTSISMFPKMCEKAGLKYESLIDLLIEQGLERFKKRRALKTSFR